MSLHLLQMLVGVEDINQYIGRNNFGSVYDRDGARRGEQGEMPILPLNAAL